MIWPFPSQKQRQVNYQQFRRNFSFFYEVCFLEYLMDMHGETISVPTFYLLSQHKQKTYNIITMALGVCLTWVYSKWNKDLEKFF